MTPADDLGSRLSRLESKLGTSLFESNENIARGSDLNSLLDAFNRLEIERRPPVPPSAKASSSSKRSALHEEFRAIDRLLEELDMSPFVGPSLVEGSNNAPMVFRRREILASCESLKKDFELLTKIRDLTAIGRKAGDNNESKIVDCPIVSSDRYDIAINPDATERLSNICFRAANLNKRAIVLSHRADKLLSSYSEVMGALSEKIVLASEQIENKE